MRRQLLIIFTLSLMSLSVIQGQDEVQKQEVNPLKQGVSFKFTEDGKYAMKIGFGSQLWARYSQLNPNTLDLSGDEINNHFDFLIRRSFLKVQASLDRLFFISVFGVRSQTQMEAFSPFASSNPQFFFYDLYSSYSFFDKHLYVGYGLNLYRGLSRYASASSVTTLGADVPMLAGPNVITTEQLARNLGFFADGLAGSFSYRLVVASPFVTDSDSRPPFDINKAADIPNTKIKTEGYFSWQFFDKEIIPVPFTSGTYIGKKKMLNIGAGFKYHPQSTASINDAGDTIKHDQLHFAGDIFMELPFKGGSALTVYGAFFLFDFGPNYLINGSVGNTFKSSSPSGAGNVEPLNGTGTGVSTQLAWLFPYKVRQTDRIQAYYEGEYRSFEALDDIALHHNLGINYYILDNNLKFTLQHEIRPYFEGTVQKSYKNQVIFKVQVLI